MAQYAFYSFKPDRPTPLVERMLPVPVRRYMEDRIFSGQKVRVDLIYEELACFLTEHPGFRGIYAGTNSTLAWLLGLAEGLDGDPDAAGRFLASGLEQDPDNVLLRSNFALALQLAGKDDEAIDQYELVLADPGGRDNPVVRLLAARLYVEQDEYVKAYELLDGLAKGLPAGDGFWDFLAEVRELAGLEPEGEEFAAAGDAVTCVNCGSSLSPGSAFCNECGTPVGEPERAPAFCSECGASLYDDSAFCSECGSPVGAARRPASCPSCGAAVPGDSVFCGTCGREL